MTTAIGADRDGRASFFPHRAFATAVVLIVLVGCQSPVAPSSLSGTYAGTVESPSFAGVGTFDLSLTQTGSTLTGTWMATFQDGFNGGTLTGAVEDGHITAILAPQDPEVCPLALDAVAARARITGTYAAFDCRTAITGVISVSKSD
jgi:hypothetical protein